METFKLLFRLILRKLLVVSVADVQNLFLLSYFEF